MNSSKPRALGFAVGALILTVLTGCASIINGSEQSVKVDTVSASGEAIEGAECALSNDKGRAIVLSGQAGTVRRSGGNLRVECTHADRAPAVGEAISRANAGLAGNIIFGGIIGVAIDAGTGSAYTYPTWMQLVFGQERLYDRSGHRNDEMVPGTLVKAVQVPVAGAKVASVPVGAVAPAGAGTPVAAGAGIRAPQRQGHVLE